MTDSRRDFLMRFAATALAAAGTGCQSTAERQPERALNPDRPPAPVYGMPPPRPTADEFAAVVGDRVPFDVGKHGLGAEAKAMLDKQTAWLRANERFLIIVEGHADDPGTREHNLTLSERRAEAVKVYMAAKGIPDERIKTVSYGKERPIAPGSSEEARAQNRCAVIVLSK